MSAARSSSAVLDGVVELADAAVLGHGVVKVRLAAGVPLGILDQAHAVDPLLVERPDLGTVRRVEARRIVRVQREVQMRDRGAHVAERLGPQDRAVAVHVRDVGDELQMEHLLVNHRLDQLERVARAINDREHRRHVVRNRPRLQLGRRLQVALQVPTIPLIIPQFHDHCLRCTDRRSDVGGRRARGTNSPPSAPTTHPVRETPTRVERTLPRWRRAMVKINWLPPARAHPSGHADPSRPPPASAPRRSLDEP
jgi:hypothetical protein